MPALAALLRANWLVALLAAASVALHVRGAVRRRWSMSAAVVIALLAGHFLLPLAASQGVSSSDLGLLVAAAGAGAMFVATLVLLATGAWSRTLAIGSAIVLAVGVGGLAVGPAQAAGADLSKAVGTLQFVHPVWLWLLLIVPAIVLMSRDSLAGLGPVRRLVVVAARCLVVALLVVAVAEPRLRRASDRLAIIFVIDRSISVPRDIDPATFDSPGGAVDRRWQRLQQVMNEALARRGADRRDDLAGVILFARRPKLVLPPRSVDRLVVPPENLLGLDDTYTDIASALKLALASFPEGVRRRVVLVSDGNENLGNAREQAELARKNGVHIDTVVIAPGPRVSNEVLVQAVEAPPRTEKGARLPIHVFVRNAHPTRPVLGTLELIQNRNGVERPIPIEDGLDVIDAKAQPARVRLPPGLRMFSFRDNVEAKDEEEISLTYRAVFQPLEPLPGDRVQNNRALAHVIARDRRRILFLEADGVEPGRFTHQHLIDRLIAARFEVHPLNVARLPNGRDDLLHFLSNYGCVIIANVPSELLTKEQQEAVRGNTHEQGCGLVMIGGPESYGAGGYQQTPVEKALPVDCQIKALSAAGKGGLVLIMHASEMADGNKWQKEIAKLAIQRLSPIDMVGVLYYDLNVKWHVPFQAVGNDKGRLLTMVDRMTPGDMLDFDPYLKAAYDTLDNPAHNLATKHVILISDGDPALGGVGRQALQDMRDGGISCTTVGVATHGAPEAKRLEEMAIGRPGETKPPFYNVTDPRRLPAIYIKESRRVSQSYLYEKAFRPRLVMRDGPTEGLADPLPELHGFIRTTLKPSPLAQMLIEGPNAYDQRFPILATWQYGLGRAAAFTSDARSRPPNVTFWDRDWASSDMYLRFWEQTVAWALRGGESDRLSVTTEYREGKVRVVVEARDDRGKPVTDLTITAKVSAPAADDEARGIDLRFEQRTGGTYEAEFRAEEVGSYIVNVVAKQHVPGYNGRSRSGLPKTVTEKAGRLYLADGTEVKRRPNGSLVYADDGTPVVGGTHEVTDRQRSAVTVSYSPEYADLGSDAALLRELSRITGGKSYDEDFDELMRLVRAGEFHRPAPEVARALLPLWYWLVFAAALALVLDVGVRRIAVEPAQVRATLAHVWDRLRHRRAAEDAGVDYLERLRRRKEAADEAVERERSGRRFEPTDAPAEPPPPGADAGPTPTPPAPPREAKPAEPAGEEEDYFTKLRRAKKRAPHERGDESPPP